MEAVTMEIVPDLQTIFPASQVKVIKLLGYSNFNKEQNKYKAYSAAKRPFMKEWQNMDKPGLSEKEVTYWLRGGGWTGLVIPTGYIVIDIDEQKEGELIYKALLQDRLNFHAIKTNRGFQFFFKDTGEISGQDSSVLMSGGFIGDYRLAERGQIVLPSKNTTNRFWIHVAKGQLSPMPIYFKRLKKCSQKERPFPIPLVEGGRNNAMYSHACRLVEYGYEPEEVHEITSFLNKYFFEPSLEHTEYINTLKSALQHEKSGRKYGSLSTGQHQQQVTKAKRFNLTEMGNAERLVSRNGQDLRYCVEFEEWLIWNGHTWIQDTKRQIERIAIKTFREMYAEAANEDDERRTQLVKWAQSTERSSVFLNSINRAEAMLPVSQDELNKNKYLLNCKNGVVNLKTGELLKHDRKYLMSKNTHIAYDPNAECPEWNRFLESIMQNDKGNIKQEMIDFLQKAIGYALTGDISEQVVFFLWGNGRNGKSTFINIVKEILGDYGKQTNSDTFTSNYQGGSGINNDIARLHGSRFVSAVESEDGHQLKESLIKQLSGGEPVTARFLRKEFFEFEPEFKIFFTTNHKPIIKGDDDGIWRRIRLIPFARKIPDEEVDIRLPEKLRNELPGIFRWAVEGCMKWKNERLGEPDEVKHATDAYKEEMDLLSAFLEDCCTIAPEARCQVKELHREYMLWAEENGEYPMKMRSFSSRLMMKGFEKRKSTGNKTFFFGIGLAAEHR